MWHVWGTGEVYTGFWWGVQKKRGHLENQGVDERIVLTWNFKKCDWGRDIDWTNLTQDRDSWRAVVDMVMNLCVP
jgi:hypothetical protein